MRDVVVPRQAFSVGLVVLFELVVGLLVLSRGRAVDVGVAATVLWVLFLLPFLPFVPMGVTNVILALLQAAVALRRYERPIWSVLSGRGSRSVARKG